MQSTAPIIAKRHDPRAQAHATGARPSGWALVGSPPLPRPDFDSARQSQVTLAWLAEADTVSKARSAWPLLVHVAALCANNQDHHCDVDLTAFSRDCRTEYWTVRGWLNRLSREGLVAATQFRDHVRCTCLCPSAKAVRAPPKAVPMTNAPRATGVVTVPPALPRSVTPSVLEELLERIVKLEAIYAKKKGTANED